MKQLINEKSWRNKVECGRKKAKAKTKDEVDDKAQSKRFIEVARALGADQSGKALERAMDALLSPAKESPQEKPKK